MEPRVVIVTRQTEYERMIARYGTASQSSYVVANSARSYAASTGNSVEEEVPANGLVVPTWDGANNIEMASVSYAGGRRNVRSATASRAERSNKANLDNKAKLEHERYHVAVSRIAAAIPQTWRQVRVTREYIDRYNFERDDIVCVVGRDGLVANVSSYLTEGQPVVGFNHAPETYPGVLCPWDPFLDDITPVLRMTHARDHISERTMVEAKLDNDQSLVCLNEIYVGHHSHQSARYRIWSDANEEDQSSSGVIVSTGTGATGWASSIYHSLDSEARSRVRVPSPQDEALAFFVREPWESPGTKAYIRCGNVRTNINNSRSSTLVMTSQMEEGGVIFGDGIETDSIEFAYGRVAMVDIADQKLHLVVKE